MNLIKARPLHQRIFSCLCADMDADHEALVLYPEVWRLLRDRVLKRVCDLRGEFAIFLRQQNFMALAEKYRQEDLIQRLLILPIYLTL